MDDHEHGSVANNPFKEHGKQKEHGPNDMCNSAQSSNVERRIKVLLLLNQTGLGHDKRTTKGLYAEEPVYAEPRISKWLELRIRRAETKSLLTSLDRIQLTFKDKRDGKLRWNLTHRNLTLPVNADYEPFQLALLWYCKPGLKKINSAKKAESIRQGTESAHRKDSAAQFSSPTNMASYRNPDYIRGRNKAERREHRRERNRNKGNTMKIAQGIIGSKIVRNIPAKCQRKYLDKCQQYGLMPPHGKKCTRYAEITALTHSTRVGGGELDAKDKELFLLYLARISQVPQQPPVGIEGQQTLSYKDFTKLSNKKKLKAFNDLGLHAKSLETVGRFFRRDDELYPETHTTYDLPDMDIHSLDTVDLLHHHGHMTTKLVRLKKIRRTLQMEAKESLKAQERRASVLGIENIPTIGSARMDNIIGCNKAITTHAKMLTQLDKEIKHHIAKHNIDLPIVHVDSDEWLQEPTQATTRRHTHNSGRKGRLHTKRTGKEPASTSTDTEVRSEPTTGAVEPTLIQQLHAEKKRMRTFLPIGNKHYTGEGIRGGYLDEHQRQTTAAAELKISTFNIRGLTREKLDMLLQFMISENIDVLTCIDAQLTVKSGKYYGKMAKTRLGAGTVTHNSPCLSNYGGKSESRMTKAGGIFIIIGPKWGTSQTQFKTDETGPNRLSAGVLALSLKHI